MCVDPLELVSSMKAECLFGVVGSSDEEEVVGEPCDSGGCCFLAGGKVCQHHVRAQPEDTRTDVITYLLGLMARLCG